MWFWGRLEPEQRTLLVVLLTRFPRVLLSSLDANIKCPVLASDPGFGCWDRGITTDYRDGRWVELENDQALANIQDNMDGIVPIYEKLAFQTFTWQERQTPEGQQRLNTAIYLESRGEQTVGSL